VRAEGGENFCVCGGKAKWKGWESDGGVDVV
jgi:hypothetical protein